MTTSFAGRCGAENAPSSHTSALAVHDLGTANPSRVHLTVPPGFRQKNAAIALHHADLDRSEIEQREGFRVTTPLRAIAETAEVDADQDVLDSAVADLLNRGTATRRQLLHAAQRLGARAELGVERALRVELDELFPLGRRLHATALRLQVQATAQRLEDELGDEHTSFITGCPRDWAQLPRPELPLIIGLDGGYVHSSMQRSRRDGWFEVIAGKAVPATGKSSCFGYVQTYDKKPKRRLFDVLAAHGMQANQQVTFFTDGGDHYRRWYPNFTHTPDQQHQAASSTVGLRRFSMRVMYVSATLTTPIFVINVALHKPILDALLYSLTVPVGITGSHCPRSCPPACATGSRRMRHHHHALHGFDAFAPPPYDDYSPRRR